MGMGIGIRVGCEYGWVCFRLVLVWALVDWLRFKGCGWLSVGAWLALFQAAGCWGLVGWLAGSGSGWLWLDVVSGYWGGGFQFAFGADWLCFRLAEV